MTCVSERTRDIEPIARIRKLTVTEQKRSILIVDDSVVTVEVTCDALETIFQVFKAYSAAEALEVLAANYVDIVLADYMMPVTNGLELFAIMDSKFPFVGKVLFTAHSNARAVVDALNNGHVDKCVSKPWDNDLHLPIIDDFFAAQKKKIADAQTLHNARLVALGELSAGIIHEIRAPLSFVDSNIANFVRFSEKIMGLFDGYDELNMPDEIKQEIERKKKDIGYDYLRTRMAEMVGKSREGVNQIKEIVANIKTLSAQTDSRFADADINDAIDLALRITAHEYKGKVEIIKDYGTLPLVKCNVAKMNQVFVNLLINACHAITEKGTITVKTFTDDGMAVITISDTGEGIPESVKERIFDSFFTTKGSGSGTGLGLSISRRIINEHSGVMLLDSTLGEGTAFTIKVPLNRE